MLQLGRTVSKQALHDSIFAQEDEAGTDAVDLYVHRLRRRLEGHRAAIITLRGVGYLLRPREEE